jgi:hypothetical protein
MHVQTLLSTCALALTANALLVPPPIDTEHTKLWDKAPEDAGLTLSLPCTHCPQAIADDNGKIAAWKEEDVQTVLKMNFAVADNQITFNGKSFYPPTRENMAMAKSVKQDYARGEDRQVKASLSDDIVISTSIDVHKKMDVATVDMSKIAKGENPFSRTPMRRISFEVLGLADKVVHLDTVELLFTESQDEGLSIYGVRTVPYAVHSTPEGDACTTVLCRVRATIKAHVDAFRASAATKMNSAKTSCMRKIKAICGSFRMSAPRPHGGLHRPKMHGGIPKFSGDATLAPGGRNHPHGPFPHHHSGHHHSGHHHGASHAVHMIGRFFRHVVLPIFIGVAAGMAVSGIGMLIGQAIVMLFMRRSGNEYLSVAQTEEQEENRESFDELPKYEEAPVYEEAPAYTDEKRETED